MSDVQIVKLTTGEDIMGKISEYELPDEGKVLKIEKPVAIMLRAKDERGEQFGVGLAPYAVYAENHTITVMPTHVVALFSPEAKLKEEYLSKVTGLEAPSTAETQQILREGKH